MRAGPTQCLTRSVAFGPGPVLGTNVGCHEAYVGWRQALGELMVGLVPEPEFDPRIAAVLERLRKTPSPSPSIGDLARIAYLSES